MEAGSLIEDEQFAALKQTFLAKGKGRRPDLPPLTAVTNKLLLQLNQLRILSGEPWTTVETWFLRIGIASLKRHKIRGLIERTWKAFQSLPADQWEEFVEQELDLNVISSILSAVGITKKNACHPPTENGLQFVPNEAVIDLYQYFKGENSCKDYMFKWLLSFCTMKDTEIDIVSSVTDTVKEFKKLQKDKHRNKEAFDHFLKSQFKPTCKAKSRSMPVQEHSKKVVKVFNNPSHTKTDLTIVRSMYVEEREKTEFLAEELKKVTEINNSLLVINESLQSEVSCMKQMLKDKRTERSALNLKYSTEKISVLKSKLKASQSLHYKRLKKKDKEITDLLEIVNTQKIKISELKKENAYILKDKIDLEKKIDNSDTQFDLNIKNSVNNTYSDDVRKTVIALQSEAGVVAAKVGVVIKIVSQGIFHHELSENLPCTQTAININNEGGVVSKVQAAEKILNSDNVTLHLDGTSKDHSKIVGHQVTLDDGSSLSLGFTHVVSEDASTLLDITLNVFQNISDCYGNLTKVSSQEIFRKILSKVTSTMSDRAAVMKSFGEKFSQFLQSEIGDEVQVHFLFCNAHFLLGLSSSCLKGLEKVELQMKESQGRPLGRDKDALFKRFHSDNEVATNRLIRTLCDILGPRGDQKNGCRVEWTSFCEDSTIPSFKANRFNCFFEAAAAIIYHLDKIKLFFTGGVLPDDVNLKIKSVAADIQDENLLYCLAGIALMFLNVTEPYWALLKSGIKYIDFHSHVQSLHSCLLRWSSCPSELLISSVSVFGEKFVNSSPVSDSVYKFIEHLDGNRMISVLKILCSECLFVVERQLCDFLSFKDGKFSHCLDEETANTLKHCPITNLLGESIFGDLDQDINKCPNRTFFSRSSSNMIKRNKTVKYIISQNRLKRAKLFAFARANCRPSLKEAKAYEKEIKLKVKQKLIENQEKKNQ